MAERGTDILVIGGGPAGVAAAMSAQNTYTEKKITLIRRESAAVIPCGIPYTITSLEKPEDDVIPDKLLEGKGIQIIVDEVLDINERSAVLKGGNVIDYDRLVLATGSVSVLPRIEGIELDNVYSIKKSLDFLKKFKIKAAKSENVVIVGGGFIGFEFADEILKLNKNVTIVEKLPHCLSSAFDDEFCEMAESEMRRIGAKVITGRTVEKIEGKSKVESILLDNEERIPTDLVLVSVGYKPNVELAKKANLRMGTSGAIWVDEYLRTSDHRIFAVGDCAEKKGFLTRKPVMVMLASTAMAEGRLAGSNLFRIKVIREFHGVLWTFSTKFGNLSLAETGLTERAAKESGLDYVVGIAKTADRHPGKIKDATQVFCKLIFSRYSHLLLGAEIAGGKSVGEMINVVSVMIQKGLTDMEIDTLQIGTHPLLTPSPIAYPLINASADAILKWYKS